MADEYKLKEHSALPRPAGPVMVCILDGYGENEFTDEFNAVVQADTPCFDKLRANTDRFRCGQLYLSKSMLGARCSGTPRTSDQC